MNIESFSGAATVALASTIVFVLAVKSLQLIARSVYPGSSFSDSIMREAAQRFRDEFERLSNTQATYLSAALVFVVLFVVAHVLRAERLYEGYSDWQLYLFVFVLSIGALLALLILRRHRPALHARVVERRTEQCEVIAGRQRAAGGEGHHDREGRQAEQECTHWGFLS